MTKSASSRASRIPIRWDVDGAFLIGLVLLLGAFLLAGGARDDLASLLVWRPLSALLLVFAVFFYGANAWRAGRPLVLFAVALFGLVLLHLIPLPPALWTSVPGREIVADIYRAAGMELPWQPLSMAQARTWNALFSLFGPIAMVIVALTLPEQKHKHLLYVLLGLGFASGIFGLIQAIGPAYGPFYYYRITNNGNSVGFFANRNHQAAMLATLLPLLAANLSLFRGKPDKLFFQRALTLALGGLVIPLVLMTGSRTGIVLAVAGAGLAWWVYRPPIASGRVVGTRSEHRSRLVGLAIAAALVALIVIVAMRSPALERLLGSDPAADLRLKALPIVMRETWAYLPFGSGIGTFVEAYEISEPDVLISERYFNHAHNDYIEILMTGGVPALLLLLCAFGLGLVALRALVARRRVNPGDPGFTGHILGRAGLAVLAILAVASATDYPLRVPSLMLYAAVAAVWCLNAVKAYRNSASL